MHRCLELARIGCYYVAPNPMVGAMLVDEQTQTVVAEGWHRQYGGPHAEVNCFADAEQQLAHLSADERAAYIRTLTLYVSLEPCCHYGKTPPCADLVIRYGVRRVVVGSLDPNPLVAGKGVSRLQDAGIEVTTGVDEQECLSLNKRFVTLHTLNRPYVVLKWAQTADGFVDFIRDTGKPLRISSDLTKRLVHKHRAENMSILIGTRTALLDDPHLTNTKWIGRQPVRVVLDRHSRIPNTAQLFSDEAQTIVYREQTDWQFVLSDLAERQIHSVLVEGGPTLLKHILDSGIWDEMHIEVNTALRIGQGVPAPQVTLPEQYEQTGDSRLYTILNSLSKSDDNKIER